MPPGYSSSPVGNGTRGLSKYSILIFLERLWLALFAILLVKPSLQNRRKCSPLEIDGLRILSLVVYPLSVDNCRKEGLELQHSHPRIQWHVNDITVSRIAVPFSVFSCCSLYSLSLYHEKKNWNCPIQSPEKRSWLDCGRISENKQVDSTDVTEIVLNETIQFSGLLRVFCGCSAIGPSADKRVDVTRK
jgi:hypothetical protein